MCIVAFYWFSLTGASVYWCMNGILFSDIEMYTWFLLSFIKFIEKEVILYLQHYDLFRNHSNILIEMCSHESEQYKSGPVDGS